MCNVCTGTLLERPSLIVFLVMIYLILDSIRSHYNVGAIFRTADAIGVTKIFLCGYTPAPIDRFGREVPEIAKTSLGAAKRVSWSQASQVIDVIAELKQNGVTVISIEQSERAVSLYDVECQGDVAVVFGNEVDGVSQAAMELSDMIVDLPMYGTKESLNVSVTVGIVLYDLKHRHSL